MYLIPGQRVGYLTYAVVAAAIGPASSVAGLSNVPTELGVPE